MKLETAVIITKGLCFLVAGATAPLATGLAQWVDSGQWPPTINWVVIAAGCAAGAAAQMLAFLSQSFGEYKVQMKEQDAAEAAAPIPAGQPPPPKVG